ncbi:hypothetical protein TKK_0006528 [Trichogramma kaykai]
MYRFNRSHAILGGGNGQDDARLPVFRPPNAAAAARNARSQAAAPSQQAPSTGRGRGSRYPNNRQAADADEADSAGPSTSRSGVQTRSRTSSVPTNFRTGSHTVISNHVMEAICESMTSSVVFPTSSMLAIGSPGVMQDLCMMTIYITTSSTQYLLGGWTTGHTPAVDQEIGGYYPERRLMLRHEIYWRGPIRERCLDSSVMNDFMGLFYFLLIHRCVLEGVDQVLAPFPDAGAVQQIANNDQAAAVLVAAVQANRFILTQGKGFELGDLDLVYWLNRPGQVVLAPPPPAQLQPVRMLRFLMEQASNRAERDFFVVGMYEAANPINGFLWEALPAVAQEPGENGQVPPPPALQAHDEAANQASRKHRS